MRVACCLDSLTPIAQLIVVAVQAKRTSGVMNVVVVVVVVVAVAVAVAEAEVG